MEIRKKNRLLAYHMASPVPPEEWKEIVGGKKNNGTICSKMTHNFSSPGGSADFMPDRVIDN